MLLFPTQAHQSSEIPQNIWKHFEITLSKTFEFKIRLNWILTNIWFACCWFWKCLGRALNKLFYSHWHFDEWNMDKWDQMTARAMRVDPWGRRCLRQHAGDASQQRWPVLNSPYPAQDHLSAEIIYQSRSFINSLTHPTHRNESASGDV